MCSCLKILFHRHPFREHTGHATAFSNDNIIMEGERASPKKTRRSALSPKSLFRRKASGVVDLEKLDLVSWRHCFIFLIGTKIMDTSDAWKKRAGSKPEMNSVTLPATVLRVLSQIEREERERAASDRLSYDLRQIEKEVMSITHDHLKFFRNTFHVLCLYAMTFHHDTFSKRF